jgi:hypothetical protein
MKTYSQSKVAKDAKTGRFVSVSSLKPMHAKSEKVKEAAGPAVEILSAMYGIEGNRISVTPIVGKKMTNKIAGSDPAPKVKKDVIVKAKVDGTEVEKTFSEGEVISF